MVRNFNFHMQLGDVKGVLICFFSEEGGNASLLKIEDLYFAPRPKVAELGHITVEQKYEIQTLLKLGCMQCEIASRLAKPSR